MKLHYLFLAAIIYVIGCSTPQDKTPKNTATKNASDSSVQKPDADVATILSKKEIPVLCYHHIRNTATGKTMSVYEVMPTTFAEEMKALNDSGYKTILPDELYEYLVHDGKLPAKPVMLTFDDTDEEQFSIGAAEMKKYNFKGVFFVMTVSINRPRYMTKEQIKQLSDEGNVIAAHTWDHHMVTKYEDADWDLQLTKPQKQLEAITGKPIKYFAFPFGLWNQPALVQLKNRDYKLAFALSGKRDSTEPLYTVRRMLVPGQWSVPGMFKSMKATFHLQ